ncbi:protein translocase subunit SecD [bacterium]|nr:protein translocase subunit SecD [bacterium]
MKKRNTTFRLGLTIFFLLVAVYYLYPTFSFNSLQKEQAAEISSLAAVTGQSEVDLNRAIVEGRGQDVMDMIAQADSLSDADKEAAQEKALYLIGDFANELDANSKKALKLGLDLQGGMRLVLEVNLVELMDQIAKNKDVQFNALMAEISSRLRDPNADFNETVLDVFESSEVRLSRYFHETRSSNRQVLDYLGDEADDAISRSLEILRNRIDQFGVSEPSIMRQGKRRIVVELPGVQDPSRARSLVGKTALLEFKLLVEPEIAQKVLEDIDDFLRREKGLLAVADTMSEAESLAKTEEETTAPVADDKVIDAGDLFSEEIDVSALGKDTSLVVAEGLIEEHPFYGLLRNVGDAVAVIDQNRRAVDAILARAEIRALIPGEVEVIWSNEKIVGPDGNEYWNMYVVKSEPEMTGKYLTKADVEIGSGASPGSEGQAIVSLAMNRQGARIFARVTGANVGRKLAIVLDKHVYMAPVIKVKIPDGRAIIEGSDSMEAARDLAIVLRAGALPAPVDFIEERTVGPSLGHDSIAKGKFSALLSLIIVGLFMLIYYRFAGLFANIALILNIFFIMAILAGFQGTLTMPGIAGIILTIGMAVDANVLIYERIREELRTGKTVKASIDAGYARATVTVLDANITTVIASIVLYQFGTGPIKGFALTLVIGIFASLYTALIGTRLFFDIYTQRFSPTKLSI